MIPANGVNPIVVSTECPPLTADKDPPFPIWMVMIFVSANGFYNN